MNICQETLETETMRANEFSLIVFFIVLVELVDSLNRANFPVDFLFGTASSSYQVYVWTGYLVIAHFIVENQKLLKQ